MVSALCGRIRHCFVCIFVTRYTPSARLAISVTGVCWVAVCRDVFSIDARMSAVDGGFRHPGMLHIGIVTWAGTRRQLCLSPDESGARTTVRVYLASADRDTRRAVWEVAR